MNNSEQIDIKTASDLQFRDWNACLDLFFLSFHPKTISDNHVFTATTENLGFIECRRSDKSDL